MKYVVAFNVVDRETGVPTPLKVSCEFKDLPRDAAIAAMLQYTRQHGIQVGASPCSIKSVGPRPRKPSKVRTPTL